MFNRRSLSSWIVVPPTTVAALLSHGELAAAQGQTNVAAQERYKQIIAVEADVASALAAPNAKTRLAELARAHAARLSDAPQGGDPCALALNQITLVTITLAGASPDSGLQSFADRIRPGLSNAEWRSAFDRNWRIYRDMLLDCERLAGVASPKRPLPDSLKEML